MLHLLQIAALARRTFIFQLTACLFDVWLILAGDCFELGKVAYNNGDHYHTILWMSESLDVLDTEVNKTADRALMLDYLAYSTYMVS